ncbi:protein of unknown function [Streptomyces sp. KY75]|nr:protein of unknown function [Streptomyces sp. KY75]CAD5991162.1 protein of unknown function [Streptomyces sp. KY70]
MRDAEALVAVRERRELSRAPVAAPLVPGDQVLARRDHRHVHLGHAPALPGRALRLGDDHLAQAAALGAGADREHPEVRRVATVFELAAGDQPAVALDRQQPARRSVDDRAHALLVGPLPLQEIGLGGPAGAAGVAAVGGLDEGHQRRRVRVGRVAEGQAGRAGGRGGVHGGRLRSLLLSACALLLSACRAHVRVESNATRSAPSGPRRTPFTPPRAGFGGPGLGIDYSGAVRRCTPPHRPYVRGGGSPCTEGPWPAGCCWRCAR